MSDSESTGGIPLLEPLSRSPSPSNLGKRKRDDNIEAATKKAKKIKKVKRAKKPKDINEDDLNADLGVNLAIGRMDGQLLVDHVAQRTKRFHTKLSTIELEDLYLPANAVLDTTSWEPPRTLEPLPKFLQHFAEPKEKLDIAPKAKGSPHTLIVTAAGLRAADLTRALRQFSKKDSIVAKLFAKHIKIKEAIETCRKTRMTIGVGTPQRVYDLFEDGNLSAENLKRIVLDASHIDIKKRGILEMNDVQPALIKLLNRDELKGRYGAKEKRIQLIFY